MYAILYFFRFTVIKVKSACPSQALIDPWSPMEKRSISLQLMDPSMPTGAKPYQNEANSNVEKQLLRESAFVCSMVANQQVL